MVSSQSKNSPSNIGPSQGIVKTIWQSRRGPTVEPAAEVDAGGFVDTTDRGSIPSAEHRREVPLQPLASSRAVPELFRQILASSELRGAPLVKAIEDAGRHLGIDPFGACLGLFSRVERTEPDARITFEET